MTTNGTALPGEVIIPDYPKKLDVVHQQPPSVWTTQGAPVGPQGLAYLANIDQMLVHQKIELLEACCGCETQNKYEVKNTMGQNIFYIKEDTNCLNRNCCGSARPFEMDVLDNQGARVLNFQRPLACSGCCFPCCLQSLVVSSTSQREVLGSIQQEWSLVTPFFSIRDATDNVIFIIKGRCCMCYCCCSDMHFPIFLKDGTTQVGRITKQWTGFGRETFTDADHFGITFPMDLDVKVKAVLLGACMLIDFMYFERK